MGLTMLLLFVVVGFLCLLAVFDLFIGVSNDAVNFLNSAIGSRVASFGMVLFISACGILLGALMSSGMMDIARHGVMHPSYFTLMEVMTIFLAVMVANVMVLDCFNNWGMPTSTTVSLVFGLLGATVGMALVKTLGDPSLTLDMLCNTNKALQMIIAIFVSVAVAFVAGVAVQWVSRIILSFHTQSSPGWVRVLFGTVSFSALSFFVLLKGIGGSPWIPEVCKQWMDAHPNELGGILTGAMLLISIALVLKGVNIFKPIVLYGTFALAMAFASNDLVNFIGVSMAGLDSVSTWLSAGMPDPDQFMMTSLEESARSSTDYLFVAAVIMIIAISTSKKARHVVQTSIGLSSQDDSDEMFGSSRVARSIVSAAQRQGEWFSRFVPTSVKRRIDERFTPVPLAEGVAFDEIRAAVNLVLASSLIVVGTLYKLPLSTTYVTFMVAMGTSLADRAWGRESAVFRITGVLSVIGGWLLTAGMSFAVTALVCIVLHYGSFPAILLSVIGVIVMIVHSQKRFNRQQQAENSDNMEKLMMRCQDENIVMDLLHKYMRERQSRIARSVLGWYGQIVDALMSHNSKSASQAIEEVNDLKRPLLRFRKNTFMALKRTPSSFAIERNTWLHLGISADQQWLYCLKRMAEPIIEHVGNGFNPMPAEYIVEYEDVRRRVTELMKMSSDMIETRRYDDYRTLMADADALKGELAVLRRQLLNRMQASSTNTDYNISLVYLNLLQETQELLSIMRHQLRASRKFQS